MIPQVDLFSFVVWKKLKTPKRHFEINWPLPKIVLTFHCLNIFFMLATNIVCFKINISWGCLLYQIWMKGMLDMISPKKTWILLPRIQWPKVFKLVPPTQNIFLSSEIKPVVVRSCSIRQKELDLVILNSQRGNFLPMNCYSFGKHSAPIALRWGWKNTKAFTIGWSHFRSSILTLDSGIDVPPGINVAPHLKSFTSEF